MYNFFMNIRTLSKEKLDYKTGSLPVALYPEKMIKRKDKESGYYGRIMSRGKFNIEIFYCIKLRITTLHS